MTQGYPLLPTIFNVVVDSLVLHWELLMGEGTGRDDNIGNEETQPARWMLRERNNRRP